MLRSRCILRPVNGQQRAAFSRTGGRQYYRWRRCTAVGPFGDHPQQPRADGIQGSIQVGIAQVPRQAAAHPVKDRAQIPGTLPRPINRRS